MDLLDLGNLAEVTGDLREALLLGLLCKGGIHVAELVHLVLPRQLQQLYRLVRQVDGIVGGDGDVLAPALLQVVVEHLGVFLLLPGGVEEDLLQQLQFVLLADAGGEGVAVPGLTLPGEGAEEVFLGHAVFQIHRYKVSFSYVGCPYCFRKKTFYTENFMYTMGKSRQQ